jgi:manganese/zinc/iron transport system permease protein
MNAFLVALLLQSGTTPRLVSVGAALLGVSAGAAGTFLVLRKRALVADAMAHATLPAWRSPSSSW